MLSLEKKREMVASLISKQKSKSKSLDTTGQSNDESDDDTNSENEFDEHLDWRAKQSRPKVKTDILPWSVLKLSE